MTELVAELEKTHRQAGRRIEHHGTGDLLAHAKHFSDEVMPAMAEVREVADKLEAIVADDLWPLPTYHEMLFIK